MLVYHGILVVGYPDLNTLGIILLAVCNIIGAHRRRIEKRTMNLERRNFLTGLELHSKGERNE